MLVLLHINLKTLINAISCTSQIFTNAHVNTVTEQYCSVVGCNLSFLV